MMHEKSLARRGILLCGALLAIAFAGCDDADPVSADDQALEALRQAVDPLQELAAAQQAGYTVIVKHPTKGFSCLFDAQLGAMGVHYLQGALVDDTVIVTSPEVLIFEPQEDGSSEFVAVEYIIPFSIRAETEPPPVLFGQQFKQNHTFDLWALHAWVGRDNPSGTFADYNPAVSCEFSGDILP
jgi:hypothetical protein